MIVKIKTLPSYCQAMTNIHMSQTFLPFYVLLGDKPSERCSVPTPSDHITCYFKTITIFIFKIYLKKKTLPSNWHYGSSLTITKCS